MEERSDPQRRTVTVFGSNNPEEGEAGYETALTVGRTLGQMGYTIANGGYAGTMEASARGAKEAGSSTIGVTCTLWDRKANPYIDRVIETAALLERIGTLIELGTCGYVVLPGATGTLAELGWVWELSCKGFIRERAIVCVGGFWDPLIEMMRTARGSTERFVTVIPSPQELSGVFEA